MTNHISSTFSADNSSILYLSLVRKNHTNVFRFTLTLTDDIRPEILQAAADLVYHRFPSIFAGFQPGFFQYRQVQAQTPPAVIQDPGCLITMTREELSACACRIYYNGNQIIVEGFHALTDGYGMAAAFSTLAAEYLKLRYDIRIPNGYPVMDVHSDPAPEELEDAYLKYAQGKPLHMPSRYSFQLPGKDAPHDRIYESMITLPAADILAAARRHGVSVTALLSAVMAKSAMEVQCRQTKQTLLPVRIMVPIDLRRIFPTSTLRNFILYALPTMEAAEKDLSTQALARKFSVQIKDHLKKENLAGIMAYNVKMQNAFFFRLLPSKAKCALMRLAYRFFGESNSSITFTNMGILTLPAEMIPYVRSIHLTMTPRQRSPYNCGMLSYNGTFYLNICRFPEESMLEDIFRRNLAAIMKDEGCPE